MVHYIFLLLIKGTHTCPSHHCYLEVWHSCLKWVFYNCSENIFRIYRVHGYSELFSHFYSKKVKSKQWLRYKSSPCIRDYFSCTKIVDNSYLTDLLCVCHKEEVWHWQQLLVQTKLPKVYLLWHTPSMMTFWSEHDAHQSSTTSTFQPLLQCLHLDIMRQTL